MVCEREGYFVMGKKNALRKAMACSLILSMLLQQTGTGALAESAIGMAVEEAGDTDGVSCNNRGANRKYCTGREYGCF